MAADDEKFCHVVEELLKNMAIAMDYRCWSIVNTSQLMVKDNQIGKLAGAVAMSGLMRAICVGCMSPDVVRWTFDQFSPVFSTRNGHQGWGLARCAGFVRQCGGDIMLSSIKSQASVADV